MLLRFRVSNFASIKDEQELSLIALDEHPDLATAPVPVSREAVLPAVGIFGANASGKSNIIKAINFARSAVVESHQYWLPEEPIPRWPFRLDRDSRARPTTFIFDFAHNQARYEYGFVVDDKAVSEEWLYYWPRGKRSTLFERNETRIDFGPSLTGPKVAIAEMVRENSLFLSAAAANNHPHLRSVAAWFGQWRRTSTGTRPRPPDQLDGQTISLLRYADVGIVGSAVVERSAEDLDRGRSRRYRSATPGTEPDPPAKIPTLEFIHQAETDGGGETLPWQWESSGTQTWVRLGQTAISCLRDGSILVADDLGCDLHPLLTAQLVGLFQARQTNPLGAQLIFTGHDTNILGRHVEHRLRRDQVWLTAKSRDGATRVYPLTEYGRVRDGVDDVEGRYLQGRYGAVPFFDKSLLADLTPEPKSNGS